TTQAPKRELGSASACMIGGALLSFEVDPHPARSSFEDAAPCARRARFAREATLHSTGMLSASQSRTPTRRGESLMIICGNRRRSVSAETPRISAACRNEITRCNSRSGRSSTLRFVSAICLSPQSTRMRVAAKDSTKCGRRSSHRYRQFRGRKLFRAGNSLEALRHFLNINAVALDGDLDRGHLSLMAIRLPVVLLPNTLDPLHVGDRVVNALFAFNFVLHVRIACVPRNDHAVDGVGQMLLAAFQLGRLQEIGERREDLADELARRPDVAMLRKLQFIPAFT